jgi:hypothetical protein
MSVLSNVKLCYVVLSEEAEDGERGDKIDLEITAARAALSDNGLKPERAEDIKKSSAFRRAIGRNCGKIPETTIVLKPRIWTRKKDSVLTAKIYKHQEDEYGHDVAEDHAEYELVEDVVRQISGDYDEFRKVRDTYNHAADHYVGGDIWRIIKAILEQDGLGAYACKPNGGVYFIPLRPGAEDMINKLEGFCDSIGVQFMQHDIPDVTRQRDQIAAQVAVSLTVELDAHATAIAGYGEVTKQGVVENRREAIGKTAQLITSLSGILNGKAAQLQERIAVLIASCNAKDAEIEAAVEARRKLGPARRIVQPPAAPPAVEPSEPAVVPTGSVAAAPQPATLFS